MKKQGQTGTESREENKQWLETQVNSILEPMMLEICDKKP